MNEQPRRISLSLFLFLSIFLSVGSSVFHGSSIINIKIDTRISVNLQGLKHAYTRTRNCPRGNALHASSLECEAVHAYRYLVINVETVTHTYTYLYPRIVREFILSIPINVRKPVYVTPVPTWRSWNS